MYPKQFQQKYSYSTMNIQITFTQREGTSIKKIIAKSPCGKQGDFDYTKDIILIFGRLTDSYYNISVE